MATRKSLHPRCSPGERILATELRAEGFAVPLIAIKMEVTERTVWRWLAAARRARRVRR